MADAIIQVVIQQRGERPTGRRLLADGAVQVVGPNNPPPPATERLDRDRALDWETVGQVGAAQVAEVVTAILASGVFDLPPALLINYCKEDPGTAIWVFRAGDKSTRIIVWDPKPKRDASLDHLSALLTALVAP
jgi:hypothetical protein